MKTAFSLLVVLLTLLPFNLKSAQTAQATLWCYSFRFHQGTDSFGSTLDLTTISGGPNGELRPNTSTWMWMSGFILDFVGFPIYGMVYVDLPAYADANDNGFDDVFEVSQGVGGIASGYYETSLGGGTVSANWHRPAGASTGTCVLNLRDNQYGDLGNFTHTFEVIEYRGPLAYTPATNRVSGALHVTRTLHPSAEFLGPAEFLKVPSNRFNQLDLQPGGWTNETAQSLVFSLAYVDRDLNRRTNYWGYMLFDDGEPNTGEPDYRLWLLSVDDANDADHDGIPDFSDDPDVLPPPRRPTLAFTRTGTNLWLTIQGDGGRTNRIQQATNLTSPAWQTVVSLVQTNDPQTVSLPIPTGNLSYWRVMVE